MKYIDILHASSSYEWQARMHIIDKIFSVHIGSVGRKSYVVKKAIGLFAKIDDCKKFYRALSELEKCAMQEIVHGDGVFYENRIQAKYGKSPNVSFDFWVLSSKKNSSLLAILSRQNKIAEDLRARFKTFVPEPKKTTLATLDVVPDCFVSDKSSFLITIHETEQAALADVLTMLQLCHMEILPINPATGRLPKASAHKLHALLLKGDFYTEGLEREESQSDVQIGYAGIRPFAWPLIMSVARIAYMNNSRLCLSAHGRQCFSIPAHEFIRTLWQEWMHNIAYNEIFRIDIIKGQKSERNRWNSPVKVREAIVSGLMHLPKEKWVGIDAFINFIIASGIEVVLSITPWNLSIPHLGILDRYSWAYVEGRFIRAFLLEYAATLGIIDVGLTVPWCSVEDAGGNYSPSCLSRYDGLKYLRLTPLGRYVLGLDSVYQPKMENKTACFQILPNLELPLLSGTLMPYDKLMMERFCIQKSDRVWQLSKSKILNEIERGITINDIKAMLASMIKDSQMPENVEIFLNDIAKKSTQLRFKGAYTLVECEDAKTAMMLVNDKQLKQFTQMVGEKFLLVNQGNEDKFRKCVKKQGMVIPVG